LVDTLLPADVARLVRGLDRGPEAIAAALLADHDEYTLQLAILSGLPVAYPFTAPYVVEDPDPEVRESAAARLRWWIEAARHAAAHTNWALNGNTSGP